MKSPFYAVVSTMNQMIYFIHMNYLNQKNHSSDKSNFLSGLIIELNCLEKSIIGEYFF